MLSLACLVTALFLVPAAPALAGQAASGQLFFDPCTSCHPIASGAIEGGRKLPNDFKSHEIALEGHDKLGAGEAACVVCHESADKNPGMLKTIDGTSRRYQGRRLARLLQVPLRRSTRSGRPGSTGVGPPSAPPPAATTLTRRGWIYAGPLMPFVGTGFQFRVLPDRKPFMPLMAPAPRGIPPVETPVWFAIVVTLGVVAAGGLVGTLIVGRSKR